ncbi:MAG: ATP-dependent DNA helicase RecG [Bacteroidia bacterium]
MSYLSDEQFFSREVKFLKGAGPQRAELLQQEYGIKTYGDLIQHFPYRWIDRSKFYKINELNEDSPYIQLRGKIKTITAAGEKRTNRLMATFFDDTGSIDLVWFQQIKYLRETLKAGTDYVIFGKPTVFNGKLNMVHPDMEPLATFNEQLSGNVQSMYPTTEKSKGRGLDSKAIWRMQRNLIQQLPPHIDETLPHSLINNLRLLSLHDALINIHFPEDDNKLVLAKFRLKFDELFYIQMKLLQLKLIRTEKSRGKVFSVVGEHFNNFFKNHLPFELTNAQKKVLKEIRSNTATGHQMNRLLQGDVGSGKTLVALMSMLLAIDNSTQACLMAPTEILAQQHFETISTLLKDMPLHVELLTGSTKSAKRKKLLAALVNNEIQILIGTHALIEDNVEFTDLGLAVIDEQHRFGVQQRFKLWNKNKNEPPHVLVMTATPIPRTLAMTLYGDLDVSVIDELPPGRKPITTVHRFEKNRLRVYGFLKEEIAKGRQVYIVYPLIDESETMDYMNLMQGYDAIVRDFPMPLYHVSIVHGKMKAAAKDYEMQQFVVGKTQIMVATTVIEVGVNVPNASVMVIESAERFGLSQLHQLRGRVGRGADQSYCILMTDYKLSEEARTRLKTMCETNDGFVISEVDLKLRGPGDIQGTQQSGLVNLKIADLTKDQAILEVARREAIEILKADPQLLLNENFVVKSILKKEEEQRGNWSKVS